MDYTGHTIQVKAPCACKGTGKVLRENMGMIKCQDCNGAGYIVKQMDLGDILVDTNIKKSKKR